MACARRVSNPVHVVIGTALVRVQIDLGDCSTVLVNHTTRRVRSVSGRAAEWQITCLRYLSIVPQTMGVPVFKNTGRPSSIARGACTAACRVPLDDAHTHAHTLAHLLIRTRHVTEPRALNGNPPEHEHEQHSDSHRTGGARQRLGWGPLATAIPCASIRRLQKAPHVCARATLRATQERRLALPVPPDPVQGHLLCFF
ncbi:unnamed protein product [Mycena citricolor]|uniref:Uncharacterized protein n=1 Tax=Mycena citricolor TaxID=2018698 RepID=A0AAD2HG59_9AGAR|nr:unnamed protein product [Mycena citricolor]